MSKKGSSFWESKQRVERLQMQVFLQKCTPKQAISQLTKNDLECIRFITWVFIFSAVLIEGAILFLIKSEGPISAFMVVAAPIMLTIGIRNLADLTASFQKRYWSQLIGYTGIAWFIIGCLELAIIGQITFGIIFGPFLAIAGIVLNRMSAILRWHI